LALRTIASSAAVAIYNRPSTRAGGDTARLASVMKNWSWNWALVWLIVIALGAAALYISVQRPVFVP
jgi:hypothetical protein